MVRFRARPDRRVASQGTAARPSSIQEGPHPADHYEHCRLCEVCARRDRRSEFETDNTVDRVGVDGLLSELDEYAVEQALQIKEKREGEDVTVTALCVGPEKAVDAVRKALQMGADQGVHVVDDAIAGSDAVATSLVLAEAVKKAGPGATW